MESVTPARLNHSNYQVKHEPADDVAPVAGVVDAPRIGVTETVRLRTCLCWTLLESASSTHTLDKAEPDAHAHVCRQAYWSRRRRRRPNSLPRWTQLRRPRGLSGWRARSCTRRPSPHRHIMISHCRIWRRRLRPWRETQSWSRRRHWAPHTVTCVMAVFFGSTASNSPRVWCPYCPEPCKTPIVGGHRGRDLMRLICKCHL